MITILSLYPSTVNWIGHLANGRLMWRLKSDVAFTANDKRKHCCLLNFSRVKLENFRFDGQQLNLGPISEMEVYFSQTKNIHLPKEKIGLNFTTTEHPPHGSNNAVPYYWQPPPVQLCSSHHGIKFVRLGSRIKI